MFSTNKLISYNLHMLEREKVSHLTRHWQSQPSQEVKREALSLISQLSRMESICMLCAGISAVALNSQHEYFKEMAMALFDLGVEKGLPIYDLMPWHVPEEGPRSYIHSLQEARQKVNELQQIDKQVGFLHGHYRVITPASWATVVLARENCDFLVLGLEDGWRTVKFKSAEPVAKDWQRWQWVLASGFDGYLTRISCSAYTDEGYANLLRDLQPDIYFGSADARQDMQEKMAKRASECDARYICLPKQPGLHTSDLFKKTIF
jgi:hypothetical protein